MASKDRKKMMRLKGEGNSLNYKFRMHDPRVGRFFAMDPLSPQYPWYSPYQFSGNKVIDHIELEGLEESNVNDEIPEEDANAFTMGMAAIFVYISQIGENFNQSNLGYLINEVNGNEYVSPDEMDAEDRFINGLIGFGNMAELSTLPTGVIAATRPRVGLTRTKYKKDIPSFKIVNSKVVDNVSVRKVNFQKLKMPSITVPEKPLTNSNNALVGVGPRGTIVVSKNSKSTKTFQNWNPKSGVEFIFDSERGIFVLGNPKNSNITGRPHNRLVKSIGSEVNGKHIVGGTVYKDGNGNFIFTENSGTYGENWTQGIRKLFSEFMEEMTDIKVSNQGYQPSEYGKVN